MTSNEPCTEFYSLHRTTAVQQDYTKDGIRTDSHAVGRYKTPAVPTNHPPNSYSRQWHEFYLEQPDGTEIIY